MLHFFTTYLRECHFERNPLNRPEVLDLHFMQGAAKFTFPVEWPRRARQILKRRCNYDIEFRLVSRNTRVPNNSNQQGILMLQAWSQSLGVCKEVSLSVCRLTNLSVALLVQDFKAGRLSFSRPHFESGLNRLQRVYFSTYVGLLQRGL